MRVALSQSLYGEWNNDRGTLQLSELTQGNQDEEHMGVEPRKTVTEYKEICHNLLEN
jgi:hypothetical protein